MKVTSPHDNGVTHGNLCIKGRFGFEHVQNLPDEGERDLSLYYSAARKPPRAPL